MTGAAPDRKKGVVIRQARTQRPGSGVGGIATCRFSLVCGHNGRNCACGSGVCSDGAPQQRPLQRLQHVQRRGLDCVHDGPAQGRQGGRNAGFHLQRQARRLNGTAPLCALGAAGSECRQFWPGRVQQVQDCADDIARFEGDVAVLAVTAASVTVLVIIAVAADATGAAGVATAAFPACTRTRTGTAICTAWQGSSPLQQLPRGDALQFPVKSAQLGGGLVPRRCQGINPFPLRLRLDGEVVGPGFRCVRGRHEVPQQARPRAHGEGHALRSACRGVQLLRGLCSGAGSGGTRVRPLTALQQRLSAREVLRPLQQRHRRVGRLNIHYARILRGCQVSQNGAARDGHQQCESRAKGSAAARANRGCAGTWSACDLAKDLRSKLAQVS